jgi:hypothetical protein
VGGLGYATWSVVRASLQRSTSFAIVASEGLGSAISAEMANLLSSCISGCEGTPSAMTATIATVPPTTRV